MEPSQLNSRPPNPLATATMVQKRNSACLALTGVGDTALRRIDQSKHQEVPDGSPGWLEPGGPLGHPTFPFAMRIPAGVTKRASLELCALTL